MPVHNADVATVFEDIADLLDIQGANQFRIRAYRNAARTLSQLSQPVAEMIREGKDLSELPDIGDDLAEKIEVIIETGTLPLLEELEEEIDPAMTELMDIPGLGPSRVRTLYNELGISNRAELKLAAEEGKIRSIKGFGEKTEQNILKGLKAIGKEKRWLLSRVDSVVNSLTSYLKQHDAVETVDVAGSYRRRKETIGDIDILVLSENGKTVANHFVEYEDVMDVVSKGDTRSTVHLRSDLQVDLRVVSPDSYGAALLYFTGSKAHNVALRNHAVDEGIKINEYGVFRVDNEEEERIGGATEKEIYGLFDLPYIVPELRENRGELEAARKSELPDLITLDDVRGNLHAHSTDSDGQDSLRDMAEAARKRGLEYLAITDHSPAVAVAQGIDADDLRRQMDSIDRLNETLDGIRLLKSIEVDILKDGALDLPDDVLEELDLCVCSVHTSLGLSEKDQTERILRAMENPNFHILAHPTGRRINQRGPIDVDLDRVMEAAVEHGCFLELNAQPERLDLNDVYCKRAKEIGLKISVGADAHSRAELDFLRHGVDQARRGWLEPDDVLNTKPWSEIKDLIDARR